MRVAVLGCGPAGLIAAHTAERLGHDVVVASRRVKSVISGAQVLHMPIEGVTDWRESFDVEYIKRGDQGGYAAKVYGDPSAPCSWPLYPAGPMDAWPMRATYDRLWDAWEDRIEHHDNVDRGWFEDVCIGNDVVFNTIPLPQVLKDPEWDIFSQQEVWVIQASQPTTNRRPNQITYMGSGMYPWYRHSFIQGILSWEYASHPTLQEVAYKSFGAPVRVVKPLDVVGGDDTRKELVPDNCVLVGRYGQWKKGELAHHAQEQVEGVLG